MKKGWRKAASIVAAMAVCIAAVSPQALAKTPEELQREIAEYQRQLNQLEGDASQQKKYENTLNSQISALTQQLNEYQSQIDSLTSQIHQKETEIYNLDVQVQQTQGDIDRMQADINQKEEEKKQTQDKLRACMKDDYKAGNHSTLDVLLSSQDFGQFISNVFYVQKIAQRDQALTQMLDQQVAAINQEKVVQEEKVAQLSGQKEQLTAALNDIQTQYNAVDAVRSNARSASNTLSAQLSKSKEESASIRNAKASVERAKNIAEEELEDATAAIEEATEEGGGAVIPPSPSGWLFPVAQPCHLNRGWDPPRHYGRDIGTSGGNNPIYASKSGVVIVSMFGYPGSGLEVMVMWWLSTMGTATKRFMLT